MRARYRVLSIVIVAIFIVLLVVAQPRGQKAAATTIIPILFNQEEGYISNSGINQGVGGPSIKSTYFDTKAVGSQAIAVITLANGKVFTLSANQWTAMTRGKTIAEVEADVTALVQDYFDYRLELTAKGSEGWYDCFVTKAAPLLVNQRLESASGNKVILVEHPFWIAIHIYSLDPLNFIWSSSAPDAPLTGEWWK